MATPTPSVLCLTLGPSGYTGSFIVGAVIYSITITGGPDPTRYVLTVVGSDGSMQVIPADPTSTCARLVFLGVVTVGGTFTLIVNNNTLCCGSSSSSSLAPSSSLSLSPTSPVSLPSGISLCGCTDVPNPIFASFMVAGCACLNGLVV